MGAAVKFWQEKLNSLVGNEIMIRDSGCTEKYQTYFIDYKMYLNEIEFQFSENGFCFKFRWVKEDLLWITALLQSVCACEV